MQAGRVGGIVNERLLSASPGGVAAPSLPPIASQQAPCPPGDHPMTTLSRRQWLAGTAAALPGLTPGARLAAADTPRGSPFRYMLNGATIMGQKLPITQEVDIAARAGYDAFEPWV